MDKIITKAELMTLTSRLENGIDKFILAGFFYGINGEAGYKEQLLNLQVDCVNFINSTITLPDGRVVVMDDFLKKITAEAINQSIYVKMGSQGRTNEDYALNTDSKYIIKIKPTSRNHNGLDALGEGGIKKRMAMISDFLGVKLTPSILKKSGAYNKLLIKSDWNIVEAESYLKTQGLSIRRNNLIPMLKDIKNQK